MAKIWWMVKSAAVMTILAASGLAYGQTRAPAVSPSAAFALPIVRPIADCNALQARDLFTSFGTRTTISSRVVDTAKGQFCAVKGMIAPQIGFEVYRPISKWTQRYLQAGCGGLCGNINASIGQAGGCLPATNGEFVVVASDLGHEAQMGSPGEGDFAGDPQKRIDFA